MSYWLMKTEPSSYSIDDLKREKTTPWTGVRNFQARNFMRDGMRTGDRIFFYHSSVEPAGIAGIGRIVSSAYPDPTQFDSKSPYFDPRATKEKPIWFLVDVAFVKKFDRLIPLPELRTIKALRGMMLLERGSRLSVQPVTELQFRTIGKLAVVVGHRL